VNFLLMIVKSNDVFEVPDVDAPIVVEAVHTGVDVVDTCMVVCIRMILNGSDSVGDSTGPFFHIEIYDSDSSSVKGFSNCFVFDVCRCISASILSQFFILLMLLEV
jgi:hypothetical protein